MNGVIIDTDYGYKNIIRTSAAIKGHKPHVKVGLLSSSGKHKEKREGKRSISVATVGFKNEFGDPKENIPERSFMRSAFDENKQKYIGIISRLRRELFLNKISVSKALDVIGMASQADTKNKIKTGPFTPNAPLTILLKGSSKPLIDTSQMLNSIHYEKVM